MVLHFTTVLDKQRISLLDKFFWTKKYWRYLSGGTALALQYWHRKSDDFDFFKEGELDLLELKKLLDQYFEKYEITHQAENTLYIEVNWVKVSFIAVPKMEMVKPLHEYPSFFMADAFDVAVMKLVTITHRAKFKDYVDLYCVLQDYSTQEISYGVWKKFNEIIDEELIKRTLSYLDDLDEDVEFLWKKIYKKDIQNFMKRLF